MKSTERFEKVNIDRLVPYARNARTHSKEQILQLRASLREFGFVNPVIVDKDLNVIAGHGRILAAKEEGITEVPCVFAEHLTEAQKRAYIIADNRLALNAGWDAEMLSVELADLQAADFDVSLLGFDDAELNKLLGGAEDVKEDDFDVEGELAKPAISKAGDLWLLGQHRLVCGDSTKPETFALLMDGKQANLVVTDPPYGIGIAANPVRQMHEKLDWDAAPPSAGTIADCIALGDVAIVWGGNYFTSYLPESRGWIYWDKNNGENNFSDGELAWTSFDKAMRIFTYARAKALKEGKIHPTQKPTDLYDWILKNYSEPNQKILDTHFGSGSIALAVDKANRLDKMNLHLTACEIDKEYIDKAIKRISESIKQGTLPF